jgi:hypothetical protein
VDDIMDIWVFLSHLSYITVMALLDSIDPCFFALFTGIFLSATAINYKYAIRAGAIFILSVYVGYFTLGLIAKTLLCIITIPIAYLGAFLLIYGILVLITTLLKKRLSWDQRDQLICRENDLPCKIASRLDLEQYAARGLFVVALMGLLSSFTILGCSAQLFISYVFWTEMVHLNLMAFILLTLYYVAVFVSPIIILFLSFIGIMRLKNIYFTVLKHEKTIKIMGSLIMISIGTIILIFGGTLPFLSR